MLLDLLQVDLPVDVFARVAIGAIGRHRLGPRGHLCAIECNLCLHFVDDDVLQLGRQCLIPSMTTGKAQVG